MSESSTIAEQGEVIADFLEGLAEAFGLEGTGRSEELEDDVVEVNLDGGDLGLLIGPKGNTLNALHELSKTVLQRHEPHGRRARLRLDVAGYREKRREALASFVEKLAAEVIDSGTRRKLEPMNAADRKVVHDTVNDIEGAGTLSEGDEPHRRVVIVPA